MEHAEGPDDVHVPWLRPVDPEGRLPILLTLGTAMVLQMAIPPDYTLVLPPPTPWPFQWPLVAVELGLLIMLWTVNPHRLADEKPWGKALSRGLTIALICANTVAAIALDYRILSTPAGDDAGVLLGSGAAIFITNILAFGLLYWELDRGGPFSRRKHPTKHPHPDFMFPQMATPHIAKPGWHPNLIDYLYVSVTNVMAFSPTDTMPLSRWAKAMMALQSVVAVSTVVLVIARAVNVLE